MKIDAKKYWLLLNNVNFSVNNDYFYIPDIDQYNKTEHWTIMPENGGGDCEDFALTKRKILLEELPKPSLRLATCWTERGEYHAVLIVTTDMGDYVLDNRYKFIMPWESLRYKWHKMQDEKGIWRKIIS